MNREEQNQLAENLIDEALARHACVEPRSGLERRILANLGAHSAAPQSTRWLWMLAPAALIVLVLTVAFLIHKPSAPVPVNRAEKSHPAASAVATFVPKQEFLAPPQMARGRKPVAHRFVQIAKKESTTPRLAQFPSAAPPSEQERLLIRFVAQHRQEAIQFAKDQNRPLEDLKIPDIKIAPLAKDLKSNSDE